MSFSSKVKEEITKMHNLANKEIVQYELLGYLLTNHINVEKNKLKFSTENEYNINRFSKLLNNLNYSNHSIEIIGKNFCITFPKVNLLNVEIQNNEIHLNIENIKSAIQKKEELQKAIVRGSFLGGGYISNPKTTNHLEITLANKENSLLISNILNEYEINLKQLSKKNGFCIYTKDGDEISKLLAFIGASSAVLEFEDIRVYRDMRNQINRKVNCETANLNKTVNAAFEQKEAILYLKKQGKFNSMPESLQEVANMRLEHPEATLQELGKMLVNPISKSGVNHRMQAIINIAKEEKGGQKNSEQ